MSNLPDHLRRHIMMELLVGEKIRRYNESQYDLQRNFSKVSRYRGRTFIYADNDTINDAVYHQDIAFLDTVDDSCIGIIRLRETPTYQLLKDIEKDDLEGLPEKLKNVSKTFMTDLSFFKFNDRRNRVYFITPAHIASNLQTIMALAALKADFKAPDSEGRLPIFFISRHARNRWVIPALCQTFNVNANDSGNLPKDRDIPEYPNDGDLPDMAEMATEEKRQRARIMERALKEEIDQPPPPIWDPPIIRAIKYRNLHTLRGLAMLPAGKVDWNIRFQWNHMTPLIYAIMKADEAVHSYNDWKEAVRNKLDDNQIIPLEIRAWEASKSVWAVRFLAAQCGADPALKDSTGMDAEGYAHTDPVRAALKEGLKARKALKEVFTTYPSLRFTS